MRSGGQGLTQPRPACAQSWPRGAAWGGRDVPHAPQVFHHFAGGMPVGAVRGGGVWSGVRVWEGDTMGWGAGCGGVAPGHTAENKLRGFPTQTQQQQAGGSHRVVVRMGAA